MAHMDYDPTTQKILTAALGIFGKKGYEQTTMRVVAAAAGVSRPTVYARFRNKDMLLREVTRATFERALDGVKVAVDAGGPLASVLTAVLEAYFGSLFETVLGLERYSELSAAQERLASDIVAHARQRLRAELARALHAAVPRDPQVTRTQLVDLLMLAPRAFKEPGTSARQYKHRLNALAAVVARACG